MPFSIFKNLFSKKALGIDIGVSSIKVVEVSLAGKKHKLENYFEFRFPAQKSLAFEAFDKQNLLLLTDEVAQVLNSLLQKLGIKQKKAAFAIPDFSTFFTSFTLPPMTEAEIPQAVQFEARHHIPISLSEVTFDWKIMREEEKGKPVKGSKLRVLLVAVPNNVLRAYQRLAAISQLEIVGVEAEVFGLVRAIVPEELSQQVACLVDFGWQSTTVSIVDQGRLSRSHSFDFSGIALTESLSHELNLGFAEAEKLKKEHGLDLKEERVARILINRINGLSLEIDKICHDFNQTEDREVNSVILSGGTSLLFGLKEYLGSRLQKPVRLADPFVSFDYPEKLENRLKEIGPSFAVALGVGLMAAGA